MARIIEIEMKIYAVFTYFFLPGFIVVFEKIDVFGVFFSI